ncbi:hypothetical protein [Bacillus xiamenensis]|nr:hypothetical protein [Bacillus xiamenensis]
MAKKTSKKKPVSITVRVFNEPSNEAIINSAKILKTLGTHA